MKYLSIILLSILFTNLSIGQSLFELSNIKVDSVTIVEEDGWKYKIECREFSLNSVNVPLYGDGITDQVRIDSFSLSHLDHAAAQVNIQLTICPRFAEQDTARAQSYFVVATFYDRNKQVLFGHNFISEYGFRLFDVYTELQATSMVANEGIGCFTLCGEDKIAVHQIFLYAPTKGLINEPRIEPIKYVSFKIYSLGAG